MMDIEKAFDSPDHFRLSTLKKFGFAENFTY